MSDQSENYNGKEIVIKKINSGTKLSIDEIVVEVSLDEYTGRYSTHFLPYTDYAKVLYLARHLIDSATDLGS